MKRKAFLFALLVWFTSLALSATEESVSMPRFKQVNLYYNLARPKAVVLLLSDGNQRAAGMARTLASLLNALVVDVDVKAYVRELDRSIEACGNPASDLEELSKLAQKKIKLPDYVPPILVGYSTGATLAYAALAEAPTATFEGAISLGFCPLIELLNPLCRGRGLEMDEGPKGRGFVVLPSPTLESPWIVLQAPAGAACSLETVRSFVSRTPSAQLIELPTIKDYFAETQRWLPQFKLAAGVLSHLRPSVTPVLSADLEDLPLVEIQPQGEGPDVLVVHVTGDGGYGVTDRGIANGLAGRGMPVVAFNSLKYFWTKKTLEETTHDLERILRHYLASTKKTELVLIGYSTGADILPFLINRLPDDLRYKMRLVVLMGPSLTANFSFHLSDWLTSKSRPDDVAVLPEIAKLNNVVLFCFYGEKDKSEICHRITLPNLKVFSIPSGHRFGPIFRPIVRAVLDELGVPQVQAPDHRPPC